MSLWFGMQLQADNLLSMQRTLEWMPISVKATTTIPPQSLLQPDTFQSYSRDTVFSTEVLLTYENLLKVKQKMFTEV